MTTYRKALIILTLVPALGVPAWGAGPSRWTITETTAGKEPKTVVYAWTPAGAGQRSLVGQNPQKTRTTTVGPTGETLVWKRISADGTSVKLVREGQELLLRSDGTTTRLPLDRNPWLQDLNQLASFAAGPDREIRFTTFADLPDARLKAQDLTGFKATKVRTEDQRWGTGSGPCWRVRVTFDDLRSAFWGADYWFRVADGQMVRYEEVRGGPGTPVTVGLLTSEEK